MKCLVAATCMAVLAVACTVEPVEQPIAAPTSDAVVTTPPVVVRSEPPTSPPCDLPPPVKHLGVVVEGACPDSRRVPVGTSRRIHLGMVDRMRRSSICWEPLDFDGTFWIPTQHMSSRMMGAVHGGVSGRLTLVARDRAVFRGGAVVTRRTPDEPFRRVPAKGPFLVRFERFEGGVRVIGCD